MTHHPATQQPSGNEWQPSNPPAPPPAEKQTSWFARHKVLTAILILFVFFVLASAFSGDGDGSAQTPAPAETTAAAVAEDTSAEETSTEASEDTPGGEGTAEEPAAPDLPGIGDTVRDGKFEFVVIGVEDGGTEVGNEFLSEKAQGRFRLIHLTVTNIGDEAQMMSDSNQTVRDEQGRTFEADSMAAIHLDDNDIWLEDINPGNTVTGTLVFDMPEGATPVEIELHDSMFSGGVTVSLR